MMKNTFLLFILLLSLPDLAAQTRETRISKAYAAFEKDAQLKNGLASLHVIDGKTGKVLFTKNAGVGLAPASTQKIITSATAYEILGKDFRYKTEFGISMNGSSPDLYINASGDPTLGSWRWNNHSEDSVLARVVRSINHAGIKSIGNIMVPEKNWESELIPDGWIWQDVGNYYGAGAEVLNWRENQYYLYLKSGNRIGDAVEVTGTKPLIRNHSFRSFVRTAAKGTGDQSYIYLPIGSTTLQVRGTIPQDQKQFVISGSMPSPRHQFISTLVDSLKTSGIVISEQKNLSDAMKLQIIHVEYSPVMDSILYWFLKKSINLYGEAIARTIAFTSAENASTSNGIKKLKEFWSGKGIAKTELNMVDGSGLSPLNRVTTHAQVRVLQFAKTRLWFPGFYDGLPEFNGMKMKSGTISGVKAFSGYHKTTTGQELIFSFIVNNYNGSSAALVQKMYKVLDELK